MFEANYAYFFRFSLLNSTIRATLESLLVAKRSEEVVMSLKALVNSDLYLLEENLHMLSLSLFRYCMTF